MAQVKNNPGRARQEPAPPARKHVHGMAEGTIVKRQQMATDDDPDRGRRGDGGSWQAAPHGHPMKSKGNSANRKVTPSGAGRILRWEARNGDEGWGGDYPYPHHQPPW